MAEGERGEESGGREKGREGRWVRKKKGDVTFYERLFLFCKKLKVLTSVLRIRRS